MKDSYKYEKVTEYQKAIEAAASEFRVDSDLIRAVIWFETTDRHFNREHSKSDSPAQIPPMSIPIEWWDQLRVNEIMLKDPSINIEAGTFLLSQLQARIVNPTPEKLFSLYESPSAQTISETGKTAAWYLEQRPWNWSDEEKSRMFVDLPKEKSAASRDNTGIGSPSSVVGWLQSTVTGALPSEESSKATPNKQPVNDFQQDFKEGWEKFRQAGAQATKEDWEKKSLKYDGPPKSTEDQLSETTKEAAKGALQSEVKKSAFQLAVDQDPLARSLPKGGNPKSEYDVMHKDAREKKAPAAFHFFRRLEELWEKAASALSGRDDHDSSRPTPLRKITDLPVYKPPTNDTNPLKPKPRPKGEDLPVYKPPTNDTNPLKPKPRPKA